MAGLAGRLLLTSFLATLASPLAAETRVDESSVQHIQLYDEALAGPNLPALALLDEKIFTAMALAQTSSQPPVVSITDMVDFITLDDEALALLQPWVPERPVSMLPRLAALPELAPLGPVAMPAITLSAAMPEEAIVLADGTDMMTQSGAFAIAEAPADQPTLSTAQVTRLGPAPELIAEASEIIVTSSAEHSGSLVPTAVADPVMKPKAITLAQLTPAESPAALPSAQVTRLDSAPEAPPAAPPAKEAPVAIERLAEAILLAVSENPDIQIAKARQDDALYGVMESRAGFLPKLDLALSGGPEVNIPDSADTTFEPRREGTLTMRQTVWDFGLTLYDLKRAKALYESAEWATREKIESISFEISTAYIGILERERIVDLARENVIAHKKILRMVEIQRELGLSTGADVSRVQARLSNVEAGLLDRESERDQAKENYRRLIKRLPAKVIEPPPPEVSLPLDADAAVAMIDERSPQMMQAVSDQRSLASQRRSHLGNFYPKLELEVQGNWKEQTQGDTGRARDARAMVIMRYNLFNGMADYAVKKRIDARLREIEFEVERVRREVEQDIRSDFRALDAARAKVATVDAEVEAAQKVVDLYSEQFKTGKRTAFDLLDGQQALVQAKTSQIANRFQSVISGYRVLQKLGLLFDHVSATPMSRI